MTQLRTYSNRFEKSESSSQKGKVIAQALTELKIHAVIEEEIFYPAVRRQLERDLMNEADEEHHVARVLTAELDRDGSRDDNRHANLRVKAALSSWRAGSRSAVTHGKITRKTRETEGRKTRAVTISLKRSRRGLLRPCQATLMAATFAKSWCALSSLSRFCHVVVPEVVGLAVVLATTFSCEGISRSLPSDFPPRAKWHPQLPRRVDRRKAA